MTWRRFTTLIAGLSPNSAIVTRLASRHTIGDRPGAQRVHTVRSEDAQRTFEMLFAPPKARPS